MKENRYRNVNNLRKLHPYNLLDDLLSTIENSESDVTCPLWSVEHDTEESTLSKEGTRLQVICVCGVNHVSIIVALYYYAHAVLQVFELKTRYVELHDS
jgi:hypothetical protein